MSVQTVFLPIGVGTFHMESAHEALDSSCSLIRRIAPDTLIPGDILLSVNAIDEQLDEWQRELGADFAPDLAVVQNTTFANAAYMSEILRRLSCPVVLWTLREPVLESKRLALNSLTGAFSAGNALNRFGRPFAYVYGDPGEAETERVIGAAVRAASVMRALKELKLLQIGHTPEGFSFGRAEDLDIMTTFGSRVSSIEVRELIDLAKTCSEELAIETVRKYAGQVKDLEQTAGDRIFDFGRLLWAYREYTAKNGIGALSSRCWPDLFTAYGTPVCAVLALMNDMGIPSACEADTYGALSMFIASRLSGRPVFFGDPVSLSEEDNSVTFWHCGMAPCSLARRDTGACAGVHCNRKIGPTLEFGCEPSEKATVFRVGRDAEGHFRFFIAGGSVPDRPQQYNGTSVVVQTDVNARHLVEQAVADGWEPHFAVAMDDISPELELLGRFYGIIRT